MSAVELRWTDTHNKGAELMMRSVVARLSDRYQIAVRPQDGSYRERAQLGLLQKVSLPRVPERAPDTLGAALPARLRHTLEESFGLVFGCDVRATLDGSGFAYSDQFPLARAEAAARVFERMARQGKPTVLLPQALGPFSDPDLAAAFKRIVAAATVVYARDARSLAYARDTVGHLSHKLRLAPDFTCLLPGSPTPPALDFDGSTALLVPNAKMLEKTDATTRDLYLPFMVKTADKLSTDGFRVSILVHEVGDVGLATSISQACRSPVPVIAGLDALDLKAVIAQVDLVVSSRFHALVSALSQGVPAVGVGWSHKYKALLSDYDCADLDVDIRSPDSASRALAAATAMAESTEGKRRLEARATVVRGQAIAMWDEVETILART